MNLSLFGLISLLSLMVLAISPCSAFDSMVGITSSQKKQICSGIKDSKFCYDYFTTSPHKMTDTNRSRSLLEVLLNRTRDASVENYGVIQSMMNQTTDKVLQERYSKCLDFFDTAKIIIVDTATRELEAKEYVGVMRAAEETNAEAEKCKGQFSSPPSIPPSLDQKIQQFDWICYLLSSLSNDFDLITNV